jgi:hypothetical protein
MVSGVAFNDRLDPTGTDRRDGHPPLGEESDLLVELLAVLGELPLRLRPPSLEGLLLLRSQLNVRLRKLRTAHSSSFAALRQSEGSASSVSRTRTRALWVWDGT